MVVVVFDSMPGRTCQNEISNNRLLVRYRSLRSLSHALPFVFHFSTAIHRYTYVIVPPIILPSANHLRRRSADG